MTTTKLSLTAYNRFDYMHRIFSICENNNAFNKRLTLEDIQTWLLIDAAANPNTAVLNSHITLFSDNGAGTVVRNMELYTLIPSQSQPNICAVINMDKLVLGYLNEVAITITPKEDDSDY